MRQLSGGERSRLSLARLMLDQGNLLFLDEPTNHLDLPSQEVLQEALLDFPGTIVFVSHDRELIDGLATHSWWLEPSEDPSSHIPARVKMERGGYRQHMQRGVVAPVKGRPAARMLVPAPVPEAATEALAQQPKPPSRAEAAADRRLRAAAAKRVADLEKQVAAGEARLKEIEARLSDPDLYRFPMEAEILGREHKQLMALVADLVGEWEAAAEPTVDAPAADAPAGATIAGG